MISSPNFVKDEPPVNQEVSPSIIFAAVSANITPTSEFTPSIAAESIFLAPSIKGIALVIKFDKSMPILGSEAEIP